ncbi:DUF4229 domain-containing protein [Streptomyces sp. DSM 44917]|uniref:DUF4229 domain-containing protein n=1 Tax=Streptomyces boetiae TaxID=3075541 RepID=A0ABU2LC34_9ACTN|nr:DUF4229 domain-containing protein [Streptomyces sp. DSM 44917]MDT0309119.1 DUF4229 domain-containing protein [Streptomyces sp. DSM 44917]
MRTRNATLLYTGLRLAIFAASFVVIAVLAYVGVIPESVGTANPLWLMLLSIVVSAPISLVVLRGRREAMSRELAPRISRATDNARRRLNANRAMEDDAA